METKEEKTIAIELLDRFLTAVKFLWSHLRNPQSLTYYPQEKRKSNLAIYLDNLRWILRYGEINRFYYLYGFDRRDSDNLNNYMAIRPFRRIRDAANSDVWIGGRRANYRCLIQDKFIFGQFLKSLGFPTPDIIALCDKESIIWLDDRQTKSLASILERKELDVFIKELLGERADGVYHVNLNNGTLYIDEQEGTIDDLKGEIKDKCVLQQRIYQHTELSKLYQHSVNTVRIVTAHNGKGPVLVSAALRVGANGKRRDNWSAGGISVGIDIQTGQLKKQGLFRPEFGRRVEIHPDTGVRFEGFVIPCFDQVKQMALALHKFFYGIHSVGWDFAITADGPCLIEANDNWGISVVQIQDNKIKQKYLQTLVGWKEAQKKRVKAEPSPIIHLIKKPFEAIKFLAEHLHNPSIYTYYPEEQRKTDTEIYVDHIKWWLKYGELNHYYYIYGFDRKYGVNQDGYLSKKKFWKLRTKANGTVSIGGRKAVYLCLLQDKFLFGQLLKSLGFPTPPIIGLCNKNTITWFDHRKTEPLENILHADNLDIFIKELLGGCAEGIYSIKVIGRKMFLNGKETTIDKFRTMIKDKCIIQKRISQHSELCRLHPHSVNTLRLLTTIRDGRVLLLSGLFRIGVKGNHVDNWSAGGIAVGVNMQKGALQKYGLFKPDYGRKTDCHPDTGIKFENFQIPYFEQAANMAVELHKFFYGVHSIGWDIAITPDGPMFIEGNNLWEMSMFQMLDKDLKKKYYDSLPAFLVRGK
jgi:hypothetical protein